MVAVQQIVAATDMSPLSLRAVERGLEVARVTGARCAVVSALGLTALGPLQEMLGNAAPRVSETLIGRRREDLATFVTPRATRRKVGAEIDVEEGLATTVVLDSAARRNADLVVIGARGEGLVRRLLLGSTASHLLRKSRWPVLVVKKAGHGSYKSVLAAVDFSPVSESAIRMARQLAPGAMLTLLNVVDVPFEGLMNHAGVDAHTIEHYRVVARDKALRQLQALAGRVGLSQAAYSVHVMHGDAARTVLDHARAIDADLVVMGKHGTHVTEELLLGSVTRRVLSEVEADMLVVADKRWAAQITA